MKNHHSLGRRFMALIAASLLAAATAWATPGNNGEGQGGCGNGQQTNGCAGQVGGTGGQGGAGGAGGNGTGVGVGIGLGVGVGLGQGGNASATGGDARASSVSQGGDAKSSASASASNSATNTAGGGAGGSSTAKSGDITIKQGDVTYKEAAHTAYAPDVPTVAKSCRLFIGGGGTSRDGSASGIIPIGNDQTCLSVTAVQLMIEVNGATRRAGGQAPFDTTDILAVTCKIEGMKETIAACAR